jgi:hypothetical protein
MGARTSVSASRKISFLRKVRFHAWNLVHVYSHLAFLAWYSVHGGVSTAGKLVGESALV